MVNGSDADVRGLAGWTSATGKAGLKSGRAFLRRLLHDRAGNALGITLATIILLVCLAGSGTDIARAYMTKTSLQNACDAGVLAGRKAMSKTGTYSTAETAKANKMFNFNYNYLATNSGAATFTTASTATGSVTGSASVALKTMLMGIWGYKTIPLSVNCSAELQMASADVMFVLDTTGSMAYDVTNSTCCNQTNSKIVGLRSAVKAFYTTVAGAVTDKTNTRIRFGFVPYSSSVNAKDLVSSGAMPASYFASAAHYQTKMAVFNTPVYTANTPTTAAPVTETYSSAISSSNCNKYGVNNYPTSGSTPVVSTAAQPADKTSTAYAWLSWTATSGNNGTCKRTKTVTTTTYNTRYSFTTWRFGKSTLASGTTGTSGIDVSAFKGLAATAVATGINSGTTTTVPTANTVVDMRTLATMNGTNGVAGVTTTNYAWNGCIEERPTVQQLSMSPVPTGATDLDLDTVPTVDANRWRMYLEALEWYRGTNASYITSRDATAAQLTAASPSSTNDTTVQIYQQAAYCPSPMKLFTDVDVTAPNTVPTWLDTYLTGLTASGATYHDVGMIWGGRLGSPNGLFQSNVNADPTKYPSVSRHVIFMTDGVMEPTSTIYNAYGTEFWDNRIAPAGATGGSGGTLKDYHNNRFLATCEKLKQMGYTIWVIGFGQALTTQMQTCATANRAYFASNTTDLTNTFKYIAGQVADLRINQ